MDEEDKFYDSETEPSFSIEDSELIEKLNDISINNFDRKSIVPNQQFYAVQILNKKGSNSIQNVYNRIFVNKENAMKLCKQDPDNRRFKLFRNFQDAYTFSYELSEIQSGEAPSKEQIQESLSLKNNVKNQNDLSSDEKKKSQDAEKLPFSAPRKPEVNEMRFFIETNKFEPFRDKLIANPRFLITAGDAPVIYKEGFRYNALHVCAKEDRAAFCQIILNLLSSHSFLQKMYPNDTIEQSKARSHHILDLYLNTPEKGLNETPLHFATKFGSIEVARLLMSIDICCKNPRNKFGKTPSEIICTKAINQASKSNAELIKNLCEKCFYVPLFRDDDKGDAVIEKPSPKLVPTLDKTECDFTKKNFTSPSLARTHSKLAGYVGPVSPNVANEIYERLKSPAKLRRSPLNLDILRSDDYKGYERILRKMTDEMNLPWSEYWAFLDSYCNLKSPDGQEKLEIYLNQKKILNIFNSQISSIQTILNDRASNNNFKSENNEENMFVSYLKQFLTIAGQLKLILDLKDNFLSSKFEKFLKIRKFCEKKSNAISEENFDDKQIIDSFTQYMSVVIELSRLDKTSKCYFNLYKSSKDLLNILNLFKFFENFHMSPIFKKITSCSSASRPLLNTTNISTWAMRDPAKKPNKLRKALFNESDDEDEEPKVSDNDSEEENCFGDADDSVIDQLSKNKIKDDMDLLAIKLNSNFLNDSEPKTRKSLNPFEYRKKNEEEMFSVKKSSSFRRPMDVGNKLFMYGNTPSKLDRAVFLAIQDSKIDQNKHVFLSEWFNCMKNCNQSEMQKWRTPIRQNNIVMRSKSFHLA